MHPPPDAARGPSPQDLGLARAAPRSPAVRPAQVLQEVARVVVPLTCAGCGGYDTVLCTPCRARFLEAPRRVEAAAPRLDAMDGAALWPVWAVTAYTGAVRDVVVAWKDHGRTDLTRVLTATMARLARQVGPLLAEHGAVVVPVPSSGAARRRRGREPVLELARAVRAGTGAPLVRGLAHRSRLLAVRDQVGLGSRARAGNVSHAVRPATWSTGLAGEACVLVDDVLTTGATLAECARVVTAAGGRVVAGLVLAATPPPDAHGSDASAPGPGTGPMDLAR